MRVPNGFQPSEFARMVQEDQESTLAEKQERTASGATRPVGKNPLYMSNAQAEQQISPFLARNIERDAQRRNYFIAPGGARVWLDDDDSGEFAEIEMPDEHEAFGHGRTPVVGRDGR